MDMPPKSARKMSRKGKDATSDSSPRTVKITAFSSSRTVQKTKPSSGEVIPGVNTEAGAHTPDNSHMTTGGQTSTPTHDGSEFPYEIDASAIHPEISVLSAGKKLSFLCNRKNFMIVLFHGGTS